MCIWFTEEGTTTNTEERTMTNTEERTTTNTEERTTTNTEERTMTNTEDRTTTNTEERTTTNTEDQQRNFNCSISIFSSIECTYAKLYSLNTKIIGSYEYKQVYSNE